MFFSGGVVFPKNSSLVASAWQEMEARAKETMLSPMSIRFERELSISFKPIGDANTDGSYHAKTKFIKICKDNVEPGERIHEITRMDTKAGSTMGLNPAVDHFAGGAGFQAVLMRTVFSDGASSTFESNPVT